MANPSSSFSDKLAKYIAIIGGGLAICAALGVPTQLGAFGDLRIPGLPGREVASLSLSRGEGPSGTEVTVSGTGFDAGEIVEIRFQAEKIGQDTVRDNGAFSVGVQIPGSFDAFGGGRTYDISATGLSSAKRASQPFRLQPGGGGPNTGSASISLSDGRGPSGTEITISGRNFSPGEEVRVLFAATEMGRHTTDRQGRFNLKVRIPGNLDPFAPRQVAIVATGLQSAKSASAAFDLTT